MNEPLIEMFRAPAQPWQALPDGDYAIVELFGHSKLIGRIAEVERFGTKMLAIEPLFNGQLLPTVFHGGGALYGLIPCSREVAWDRMPKQVYSLPSSVAAIVPQTALPVPTPAPAFGGGGDDADHQF